MPPVPSSSSAAGASGSRWDRGFSGNITMSETSLGRGAPQGVDPSSSAASRRTAELVGPLLTIWTSGIEPRTGMRAVELLRDGRRITGVRLQQPHGVPVEVGAAGGVVIATGGFEWDPELVRASDRASVRPRPSRPTPETA